MKVGRVLPGAEPRRWWALLTLLVLLLVSVVIVQPNTAQASSIAITNGSVLPGYSVDSSITGTVRVLLRASDSASRLAVSSYANLAGVLNTANYTSTVGASTLATPGQMIGLVGSVADVNAALATLSFSAGVTSDSVSMWVSNGTDYIPLVDAGQVYFHYYGVIVGSTDYAGAVTQAAQSRSIDGIGVTSYLATPRYAVEDNYLMSKMVTLAVPQAWINARDAVVEGEWRWYGPDADGILFWSGGTAGTSVNGEYNGWGRSSATVLSEPATGNTNTNCVFFNNAYSYGGYSVGSKLGWNDGQCGYISPRVTWESRNLGSPYGQSTTPSAMNYATAALVNQVNIVTPPPAPTSLTPTPVGTGGVELSWAAPNATDPITNYIVQYSDSSTFTSNVTTLQRTASNASTATVTTLTPGTTYYFRVAAFTSLSGSFSSTASAIPLTAPGAPVDVTATPGDSELSISWSAPATEGSSSITAYRVEYRPDDGSWIVATETTTVLNHQIQALSNGTAYEIRVSARNSVWSPAASAVHSVTPVGAPSNSSLPTISSGVAGTPTLSTEGTWSGNGAPISGYNYQWWTDSSGSWVSIPQANSANFTPTPDLIGSQIRVGVTASNSSGLPTTVTSSPQTVVAGVPLAPSNVRVSAGVADGTLSISWNATSTAQTGGTLVGYRVEYSTDNSVWVTAITQTSSAVAVVNGLENNVPYYVRIQAMNSAGVHGAWGLPLAATKPYWMPINSSPQVPAVPVNSPTVAPAAIRNSVMPIEIVVKNLQTTDGRSVQVTSDGRIELSPAAAVALINGATAPVSITQVGQSVTADTGVVRFELVFPTQAGQSFSGGKLEFNAFGLASGTQVAIWIQSDPQKIADVLIGRDGSESAIVTLPSGLEPGEHTLQINGVGSDGKLFSFIYGIQVQDRVLDAASPVSAQTTNSALVTTQETPWWPVVLAGLLLALAAAGFLLALRRRVIKC